MMNAQKLFEYLSTMDRAKREDTEVLIKVKHRIPSVTLANANYIGEGESTFLGRKFFCLIIEE